MAPNDPVVEPNPLCSNGVLDGSETDIDCGGSCVKKCLQGQRCKVALDCGNRNCIPNEDSVLACDASLSVSIVSAAQVIMGITVFCFLLCILHDWKKSRDNRKKMLKRQQAKLREPSKSIAVMDKDAVQALSTSVLGTVETAKSLKMRAFQVLKRSRRLMDHPGKQMMNIEIEEYRDIRDFDVWAYRLCACNLIEITHHNVSPHQLHEAAKADSIKFVMEMEKIGDLLVKAFNLQGRGDDDAGKSFRYIYDALQKLMTDLPPMWLSRKKVIETTSQAGKKNKVNPSDLLALAKRLRETDEAKERGELIDSESELVNLFNLSDVAKRGPNDADWGASGAMYFAAERRARGLLDRFSDTPEAKAATVGTKAAHTGLIRRFKTHPEFYSILLLFYSAIFLFFGALIDRSNKGLRQNRNAVLAENPIQDLGPIPLGNNAPMGGFGVTFLPLNPGYNLDNDEVQSALLPFIYAFMHCALFTLGLLPVCFWRGIWRDVVHKYPGIRRYIPVDDFEWLHRQLGILILVFIMCGAVLWMAMLGTFLCLRSDANGANNAFLPGTVGEQYSFQACNAFDPGNDAGVTNKVDPVQNVVMLRVLVWATWFTLIPLMKIGKDAPPFFCLPILKKYWYEFCYYIHIFTALFTVTLALIARTQVFYPVLCTWPLYVVDWLREIFFHTKTLYFVPDESVWHSSSKDGKPTTMQVRFRLEKPNTVALREDAEVREKTAKDGEVKKKTKREILLEKFSNALPVKAGMWLYIKIDEIDSVWHPFSITNKSTDDFLELDIGIRGNLEPVLNDADVDFPWYMPKNKETWTYQLWVRMRNTMAERSMPHTRFPVQVRGPYGAAFISCFDKKFAGSVVIGAGTGVTAAQSVLKEFISRKKQNIPVPPFCFFVWSCQRVDDLLWVFPALRQEIADAVRSGILDERSITPNSTMLDWISVTCYVSRVEKGAKETFKSYMENEVRKARSEVDILVLQWLADQVVWGASMDDRKTHIGRLLFAVRDKLRDSEHGDKMSICYCGPTALAFVIGGAASALFPGNSSKHAMEFTTDAQG